MFVPSLPSHSEHSDVQLCYIGCSATVLLAKDRFLDAVLKSVKFFFPSPCANFIQISGWTQVLKEVQRHYLKFGSDKIPLKFLLYFFIT